MTDCTPALQGDDVLSTSSLASSVFDYIQEHGRTYNAYGERTYVLPNDEMELDRLDLQHHLLKMTFGDRLTTYEPEEKKDLHNVLDIGTGTGIWAIEYGDAHPESIVLGVDVSPVQPAFVPPNVRFEVMDVGQPWLFTFQFDFIFSRFMTGAIANWRQYIQECFDNLTPGGALEVQDISFRLRCDDGSLPQDSAFRRWAGYMLEASINLGCPLDSVDSVRELMIETGFVDVEKRAYCWPMNQWPRDPRLKKIGVWTFHDFTASLSGISLALFTRGLSWSPDELEVFLIDVRRDMKNTAYHAYWPM
ncbi:hypothetical protein PV04_04702 [Phialophora macrospora]|uniref:Methyltransferase domain-containing protein n=1 Tax=Phialophora macrospora TaxID=1851006 RepID=A0A0D2CUC3_9EURO|nr:hypothetical protein PV04_04702 [Phialophora macrospora]